MDGDFDQFEELDDDFLGSLCLDFPEKTSEHSKIIPEIIPGQTSLEPKEVYSKEDDNLCEDKHVEVPSDFSFPFEPYDIQVGFMQNLYKTLELGKIGIFESPTGTGKSLSMICGALRWLKDFEAKQQRELEELLEAERKEESEKEKQSQKPSGELDWIGAFARKQEDEARTKKLKEEQEQLIKREARLKELSTSVRLPFKRKRNVLEETFDELFKDAPVDIKQEIQAELDETETGEVGDEEALVAEYVSDDEKLDDGSKEKEEYDDDESYVTKIYYCSRTHSQLSQFVQEVVKSPHGDDTRVVSLASRQNLCINDAVKKLQNMSLINDRCLELQKNKTEKRSVRGESSTKKKKKAGACPYYRQEAMMSLRDTALVEVLDLEKLVTAGRKAKACPYYSSRYAVPAAQVVVLPYNTLLHKNTREASGIKLKDNIVIIDEAHNLVDTISNVYSVEISAGQVACAHSQLMQYMERFRSRLKAKNLMYIKQLIFILAHLIKYFGGKCGVPVDEQKLSKQETKLQTINDFLFATQLDNLNLFKIMRYCDKSQIAKKLHGFIERYQPPVVKKEEITEEKTNTWALSHFLKQLSDPSQQEQQTQVDLSKENTSPEEQKAVISSPLMHIQGFLLALTNANKDGRILVNKQGLLSKSSLKFLLLNPAVHFSEVVHEARAVIVAGGTMQPLSEFKDQLFYAAGVSPERILEYSCGHVIPPDNLLPIALARGSSGLELDFTYQSRDTPQMLSELGRVVYNVCNAVPGGVICFFPSYEYEKNVYTHWEKSGHLEKIAAKKKIFREPKKSAYVESVLSEYSQSIKKHLNNKYSQFTGAVLFCVVGGKMSEGINFSDDLGRCVVMVGLPYPNMRSPELKEKMDYLNANMPKTADGKMPGQIHYENLCMKAVNQSIGRAIRHKGDYACILLLDQRYLRPNVRAKLPAWISDKLQLMERFGPAFSSISKFFVAKK